jgi:uncharacterized repeat protein (TIGR03803 family)
MEKVLHSFDKGVHGREPYAALIDVRGTLYGTTGYGGGFGYGTVFSITTDGKEKVIHSFGKGLDGNTPSEDMIDVGGTLYGTTEGGGANCTGPYDGCGTVFSVTTDGKEKVLHSFGRGTDGRFPAAGLRDIRGTLYGTTPRGGTYGAGTVFSITMDGKEKVLYSFRGTFDGAAPTYARLLDVNGILYGTTESGGHENDGTVYSITRSGSEKVLHSFNGTDGNFPAASLINVDGMLYGTTADGGARNEGTLFRITTSGSEEVLHSFGKGTDGNAPCCGALYFSNGSLFGTTQGGGVYGGGTAFSLTP